MSDEPLITHEVFFFNGVQQIGPVRVFTEVPAEDEDEEIDEMDMLTAAAVAQNGVNHWDMRVRRLSDGHETTIEAGDARDWWA